MGFYSPNSLVQDAKRHGVIVRGPCVNASEHDCTIEPAIADEADVVEYQGASWRRGRGPLDGAARSAVAMRMGLRYVRNMGEAEISRVEAARMLGGPFRSPSDLAHRTGLPLDAYEGLAAAGALQSIGLDRREGLWAAGAMAEIDPGRLPLSPGIDPPSLDSMDERQRHLADLWATSASTSHPMQFVRDRLNGCLTVAQVLALRKTMGRVRVAGVVTHRQRPGTANGVIFFNLEDETGMLNVVVMPPVWDRHKKVARRSPALTIEGAVEFSDGVTNLVARSIEALEVPSPPSRDFR